MPRCWRLLPEVVWRAQLCGSGEKRRFSSGSRGTSCNVCQTREDQSRCLLPRINDEPVDRAASEAGGQIVERRADCSVAGRQVAERRADCSVAGRQVAERRADCSVAERQVAERRADCSVAERQVAERCADCSVAGGYWWSTAVIVQQDSGAGTSCGVFGPVRWQRAWSRWRRETELRLGRRPDQIYRKRRIGGQCRDGFNRRQE